MSNTMCIRQLFGYCRFGEVCRKNHIELCDDSTCDPLNCNKRHPKECKYVKNYKRCKFNPCKFSHITKENYDEKIKEISQKLKTVEENLNDRMSVDLKKGRK